MDHAHMDHSKMDHSAMDHGDMGGHGMGGGMGDRCSMNMLFTWDTKNLCIVFRQWHVRSTSGLVISLLLVVALAAGYEALRAASRRYENSVNKRVDSLPRREQAEASRSAHLVKAALYAAQNFYAFMLMKEAILEDAQLAEKKEILHDARKKRLTRHRLVFMTYNGWVMVAVAIGAFVGYAAFGSSTSSTKDNACH
ncbi:ctr copper transporter [Colletotrichum tamarilloi]|nr:ctr copper transporter [Colletotrichum tamarilloi]KAK1512956.1 ctr copper transporter [Colletotrichum tamarilloi]